MSRTPTNSGASTWVAAIRVYEELSRLRKEAANALEKLHPLVQDLYEELKLEEKHNLEIRVAQANKTSPHNVTEEMILSFSDLMMEQDLALLRVGRANAKRVGRVLLQTLHPDKGGDPDQFDVAKKAIDAGDVDLVRILLYKNGLPTEENAAEVMLRLQGRLMKFKGSKLHSIVSSYVSQPLDTTVYQLSLLIKQRTINLRELNTPGFHRPETEHEQE